VTCSPSFVTCCRDGSINCGLRDCAPEARISYRTPPLIQPYFHSTCFSKTVHTYITPPPPHHQHNVCFCDGQCLGLLLHLSLLPCSVGSSVHLLKGILSRANLFISAKVFPFLLAASITQSSQVFLYLFFSPFWPPLLVLFFYNLAFLPHGHTTVYFFLYNLGLVPDLMFL
jgi:hypothetical protein